MCYQRVLKNFAYALPFTQGPTSRDRVSADIAIDRMAMMPTTARDRYLFYAQHTFRSLSFPPKAYAQKWPVYKNALNSTYITPMDFLACFLWALYCAIESYRDELLMIHFDVRRIRFLDFIYSALRDMLITLQQEHWDISIVSMMIVLWVMALFPYIIMRFSITADATALIRRRKTDEAGHRCRNFKYRYDTRCYYICVNYFRRRLAGGYHISSAELYGSRIFE